MPFECSRWARKSPAGPAPTIPTCVCWRRITRVFCRRAGARPGARAGRTSSRSTVRRPCDSASAEDQRGEVVQIVLPHRERVGAPNVDVPHVWNLLFLEMPVHVLADVEERVLVAA